MGIGRMKISAHAETVRKLFMEFEDHAKKLDPCWFCGKTWSGLKLANRGHCGREHDDWCPFRILGNAVGLCVKHRVESDAEIKQAAEAELLSAIQRLFATIQKGAANLPDCPFCGYALGERGGTYHKLECIFTQLARV